MRFDHFLVVRVLIRQAFHRRTYPCLALNVLETCQVIIPIFANITIHFQLWHRWTAHGHFAVCYVNTVFQIIFQYFGHQRSLCSSVAHASSQCTGKTVAINFYQSRPKVPARRRLPDCAVALGRSATEFRQEFQLGSLARVRERQQGGHPWPVVPHASDPLPLRGPRHMSSFVSVVIGTSVGGRDRQAGVHSRGRALLRKSPGSAVRSNRDFHDTCATSYWIMRALPHVPVGLPRRLPRKSAYSCTTIGRHSLRTYICKPAICATVCVLYPPYSIAVFSPTRTHSATTHNHAS